MSALCDCFLAEIGILIAVIISSIYAYFRIQYLTWKKRGIPQPLEPSFPFGNFTKRKDASGLEQILGDIHNKLSGERLAGIYLFHRPVILIRDLKLIKNVIIKDFTSFHDRGFGINLEKNPLAGNLFLMNGQEWRNLRVKLVPTFTSGKMKMMYPTLLEVGKLLQQILEQECDKIESDVKDILARFTTDIISSVAFGLESNSLKNPDSEFRKMSLKMMKPDLRQMLKFFIVYTCPKLCDYLELTVIPKSLSDFFNGVVRDTMNHRETNNIKRNDFMQLLIELKNQGYIKDVDNPVADKENENQQKFTIEQAAAQAFIFFMAGYETSSTAMTFALYELALNPDIQKKVQKEVDQEIAKGGGEISYDALMKMDLLNRVVDETLRKYPVGGVIIRECTKEYQIPDSDIKLLPKDQVWVSIYGMHHNPEYYPEPKKFDPDRFLPENKEKRPSLTYMPFGDGPRICIGNRFALMQIKAGLSLILSKFTFQPSERTPIPIIFDSSSQMLTPKGKVYLKVTKRDQ